jgi:hypothetical protein
MRSSRLMDETYLAEWLERLTANAVTTVLDSIPASSDTVKSEGRQMKQSVFADGGGGGYFVPTVTWSWYSLLIFFMGTVLLGSGPHYPSL